MKEFNQENQKKKINMVVESSFNDFKAWVEGDYESKDYDICFYRKISVDNPRYPVNIQTKIAEGLQEKLEEYSEKKYISWVEFGVLYVDLAKKDKETPAKPKNRIGLAP